MNIKRFLTKQIIVISLSIFCLLAVIISTSYASFTSSSSNVSRTIQAGDLTVDFTKGNEIEIPSAPVSETDGWTYFNNEENYYHFTITNNGTLPAYYRIDLHSEFGDDNAGLHYLEYFLSESGEFKIIENPNIDIYAGTLEASKSISFDLGVWMTSSTPNEYQGQTANIKINIVSHVKQNYRGLDEAIKEDNLIRETQEELTDDLEKEYYVISDRVSTDCNLYPEYSSTGYTFDEITGQFTLDSYNLTDFSYQENFNDYVYNGTYSCQDGATTCNELYYQDNDGQCYKYTVTKEPTSTQGLWKNGDNYKFISPYNNILKYNNTTYHIDSIDADGYITLKESNAPQSLNWLDLTVSGTGTTNDPYVVYNG